MFHDDKELFHVVTYNKLKVGQHLEFGKNANLFCERINNLEFKRNGVDLNEFVIKNDLQNITDDDYREIKRYIYETCLLTREYALEEVRKKYYSSRPSRLKCLYACETLEQAEKWVNILMRMNKMNNLKPLQIVKLRVNGNIFKSEGNLMTRNTLSMNSKLKMAHEYWKGVKKPVEPEILVDGDVEVVEIIKEF